MYLDCYKSLGINEELCKSPNVFMKKNVRIQVIAENIIRFEYSENQVFRDLPTQRIIRRNFGPVEFRAVVKEEELILKTDKVTLFYDWKFPTMEGLQIKLNKYMSQDSTWKYGKNDYLNLKGTCRTLDNIDGEAELENGLISKSGFSSIDDSKSLNLQVDGQVVGSLSENYVDIYYFYHGDEIDDFINQWYQLSGYPIKIDRQYLGNWWSRYWEYDEQSLKAVISDFETNQIPLAVNIMDMDWHTVPDMKYGYGWTGFTWNKELFPDPDFILQWQHKKGLLTALNLHPADGFRKHEELYLELKSKLGVESDIINFEMTNPKFIEQYFKLFIDKEQKRGVDFWWLDWQQGDQTKIPNLDPLFLLNHLHFVHAKQTLSKPIIFSRYAGLGSHRYPIGFSGDTVMSWDSLKFQPYFTTNSANVGYNYWSHDIGGHFQGKMNDNLYTRWLQFGVFSPIMRLHSSKNEMIYKEPWKFNQEIYGIAKKFMQLRHRLISYIDTNNYLTTVNGRQLIRPIYYEEFNSWESYLQPNQYFFGNDIIVNPITEDIDKRINGNIIKTYLPSGTWFDIEGNEYKGSAEYITYHKLEDIPLFFRSGALVPLDQDVFTSHKKAGDYKLLVFPGDGKFSLYHENKLEIEFKSTLESDRQTINITTKRKFNLLLDFRTQNKVVKCLVNGMIVDINKEIEVSSDVKIEIIFEQHTSKTDWFELIKNFNLESDQANGLYQRLLKANDYERVNIVNVEEIDEVYKTILISEILKK